MRKKRKENTTQLLKEDLRDLQRFIDEFSMFLPLAVCTVTLMGIITYANKAFLKLTQYKEMEIVGSEIDILFEDKEVFEGLKRETLEKKLVEGREMILRPKDGKKTPVNAYTSLREGDKGVPIGYFLAFLDTTEIKKLQEGLEGKVSERTKELQERINELEKFHILTVGRELRSIELKEEIKRMKKQLEEKGIKDYK
jgi:PAS domain S-box-containing protein